MTATSFIVRTLNRVFYGQSSLITKGLLSKNNWNKSIIRTYARGFDGDGKTVGVILNKKSSSTLFIDNVYTDGFMLSDGTELAGSIIIFPHAIFSWHILRAEDVNEDALALFKILEPKVDLLIFGYGNKESYTLQVRKQFTEACKNLGLRYEALPTSQAIGVFNFMSEDRRFAAAALIPPVEIDVLKFNKKPPSYIEEEDDSSEIALKSITDSQNEVKYIK